MMSDDAPIGVLVSGGLDSAILAAHLATTRPVSPIYIRSDVIWGEVERIGLRRFLSACNSPNLAELVELQMPLEDLYGAHWCISGNDTPDHESPDEAVYLPGRNALLSVKAAIWCQLNRIEQLALAPLGTSPFPDASKSFFEPFEQAINMGSPYQVRLLRPFGEMEKRQVMELGREMPLELTFSCIRPQQDRHCGECNKCFERKKAFRAAEIVDRTQYLSAGESHATSS